MRSRLTDRPVGREMQQGEMGMPARPFERHGSCVLVTLLANSASMYSKPCGKVTRARCGLLLTGLRIGSARASTRPGTEK